MHKQKRHGGRAGDELSALRGRAIPCPGCCGYIHRCVSRRTCIYGQTATQACLPQHTLLYMHTSTYMCMKCRINPSLRRGHPRRRTSGHVVSELSVKEQPSLAPTLSLSPSLSPLSLSLSLSLSRSYIGSGHPLLLQQSGILAVC